MRFRVKLLRALEQRYRVAGRLCGTDQTVVQVLLARATESGLAYWDFPRPDCYESDPGT